LIAVALLAETSQMKTCLALVGLLGAATSLAWGESGKSPTTQVSSQDSQAAKMPDEFKPLILRSVFVRKSGAVAGSAATMKTPGSGLALRGVVRDESGEYTAIIEDPITHQIQKVENGATLAGGDVSHLTLRGFQYDIGGKSIAVAIGQTLNGEAAVVAPPAPPAAVAGAKGPKAQPNTPADADDQSPEAMRAAALLAASANLADGGKPDAVNRAGVNRRGRPSNDN
jgi:hypothetical protein